MDNQQSNNTGWLWVVSIISIAALALAWLAYNRAGENLTTQLSQETAELANETEQAATEFGNTVEETTEETLTAAEVSLARAEARAELIAIQAELEAEQDYAAAVEQVQEVRVDLRNTYQNAEASVQTEWREIDTELNQLEQSLRDGSADALEVLGGTIIMLEADVRTDEQ